MATRRITTSVVLALTVLALAAPVAAQDPAARIKERTKARISHGEAAFVEKVKGSGARGADDPGVRPGGAAGHGGRFLALVSFTQQVPARQAVNEATQAGLTIHGFRYSYGDWAGGYSAEPGTAAVVEAFEEKLREFLDSIITDGRPDAAEMKVRRAELDTHGAEIIALEARGSGPALKAFRANPLVRVIEIHDDEEVTRTAPGIRPVD